MTWTTQPRFKSGNGLTGYQIGAGPTLALLHGVGLRAEAWNGISEFLRHDFNVHAIDLPGHGQSESLRGTEARLEDYSMAIANYLDGFEKPVHLAGHSMGAMIALDIAIRWPKKIKTIAALNAIYGRSDDASKAVKARARALKTIGQNDLNTDVTMTRWFGNTPTGNALAAANACKRWLHQTSILEYYKAYQVFANHDGLSPNQLVNLSIPALFMTGSDEPNSTPQMSHDMANIAPFGTYKLIENAAHMMPMTHAQQVSISLKHYFKG